MLFSSSSNRAHRLVVDVALVVTLVAERGDVSACCFYILLVNEI